MLYSFADKSGFQAELLLSGMEVMDAIRFTLCTL